jgi:hypothetical protein
MRLTSATTRFSDSFDTSFDSLPSNSSVTAKTGFARTDGIDVGASSLARDIFIDPQPIITLDPVTRLAHSPGFAQLPASIQSSMKEELSRSPALLSPFQQLAASASFRGLPEVIQLWAVYQLGKHVPEASGRFAGAGGLGAPAGDLESQKARATLTSLFTDRGFAALSVTEQHRLTRYVGGIDPGIASPARDELGKQLSEARARGASDAEVTKMLSDFVYFQHPTEWHPSETAFPLSQPVRPFALSRATFGQGEFGPAAFQTATIDGHSVRIVLPQPPPAGAASSTQVAEALARLPAGSLRATTEVVFNPDPLSSAAAANGGNGKMVFFPSGWGAQQLLGDMIHESGHFFSDKYNGEYREGAGTQDPRWNPWVAAIESDGLFPASYGKDNWREPNKARPGEDYAEAITLYWRVKGTPLEGQMRELFPGRFAILDQQTAQDDFNAAVAGFGGQR